MTRWSAGPAKEDEAPRLALIISDWIDATDWMPRCHTRADDLAFVTGLVTSGRVTVLRDDDGPQGFLSLRGHEIEALYLDANARGAGGGQHLIDVVKASSDRLALWTFAANSGARRFYAREGFRETGGTEGDNEERLPDIRVEWERGDG